MVRLSPFEQIDFNLFQEGHFAGYARDKVRSGNWPPEGSLERAHREKEQLLPDGLQTRNHFFYNIVEDTTGQKLGMLWVYIPMDPPHREAFLYNIEIDESYRGKGYGTQALAALDELLKGMEVELLGLHVFGFNTAAFELYKRVGFEVTNINMRKVYRVE
jgi:ribosomal protein S18 acetylase RimI-like enzyme